MKKKFLILLSSFLLILFILGIIIQYFDLITKKYVVIFLLTLVNIMLIVFVNKIEFYLQEFYYDTQIRKIKSYFGNEKKRVILKSVEDSFDLLDDKIGRKILQFATTKKINVKELSYRVYCEAYLDNEDMIIILIYKENMEELKIKIEDNKFFYKYFEIM